MQQSSALSAISPAVQTHNFDTHAVRTVLKNDEAWFVASDVCAALDIRHPRTACERLDDDEKGVGTVHSLGGAQQTLIVNESGLYSLILTSRKPEAKRFKRWVTHEVLPEIRRTGGYKSAEAIHDAPYRKEANRVMLAYLENCQKALRDAGAEGAHFPEFDQQVLDGLVANHLQSARWLLSFDDNYNHMHMTRVSQEAFVMSIDGLSKRLPEMFLSTQELTKLTAACTATLTKRLALPKH